MKRYYIGVPVLLLALFGAVYWNYTQTAAATEATRATELRRAHEADEARKAEAERLARADADKHAAERAAEERRQEEEKRALWLAESHKIELETKALQEKLEAGNTELARLQAGLTAAHERVAALRQEQFEAARQVESGRIEKRNAELEIQRLTDLLAHRADSL